MSKTAQEIRDAAVAVLLRLAEKGWPIERVDAARTLLNLANTEADREFWKDKGVTVEIDPQ